MFVGIDVGLKGGIVALDDKGQIQFAFEMPLTKNKFNPVDFMLIFVYHINSVKHVFIEKAQSFPKQGIATTFNYGYHAGVIEGIITAMKFPLTLVPPASWQKKLLVGTNVSLPTKIRASQAAQRIFQTDFEKLKTKTGKIHDGLVDAALIAEYGRRCFKN